MIAYVFSKWVLKGTLFFNIQKWRNGKTVLYLANCLEKIQMATLTKISRESNIGGIGMYFALLCFLDQDRIE